MIKKTLIIISLLVPFLALSSIENTLLSVNNKIDIPLPKSIKRLVVLEGGVYAAVMSNRSADNIYYRIVDLKELKKLGAKDSVYNFLNDSFNSQSDNPSNDFEKIMIRGQFVKANNPKVNIYNYKDSKYIYDNVCSKNLDFAVLVSYEPKHQHYINSIKETKLR